MSRVFRVVAACAIVAFGACADPTGPRTPAHPQEAARPKLKPADSAQPAPLLICEWVNPFIYLCIDVDIPGVAAPHAPATVPPVK